MWKSLKFIHFLGKETRSAANATNTNEVEYTTEQDTHKEVEWGKKKW